MLKLIIIGIMLPLLLLVGLSGGAVAEEAKIEVNGRLLVTDVPAQVVNGRTIVPIRFISEAIGAGIGWDAKNQTAIVRKDYQTEALLNQAEKAVNDGKLKLEINGEIIYSTTDTPISMINGRVMVPLRFISETFGASVNWDPETQTVKIKLQQAASPALRIIGLAQTSLLKTPKYTIAETSELVVEAKSGSSAEFTLISLDYEMLGNIDAAKGEKYKKSAAKILVPIGYFEVYFEDYLQGQNLYHRESKTDAWDKKDVSLLDQSEVEKIAQSFADLSDLESALAKGNFVGQYEDIEENGKRYYLITLTSKDKEYMYDTFLQDLAITYREQFLENGILNNLSYHYKIDQNTSLPVEITIKVSATLQDEQALMSLQVDSTKIYDYNQQLEMPNLN